MKKWILLMVGLVLMVNTAFAADCQYTEIQKYSQDDIVYYHNNQKIGTNLDMNALVTVTIEGFNIRITNNLSVPISLNVNYHRDSKWFGIYEDRAVAITVKPKDFEYIKDEMNNIWGCGSWPCAISLNKYSFVDPNIIRSETISVVKEKEVCKLCLGKTCLNDGSICALPTECGGNFCVEGVCSNSEACYNNDCKCSANKIQCNDNKKCVLRSAIELDTKTICEKNEECVSGYIDPITKLCAKSPSQIQKEKDENNKNLLFAVIILSAIIVVGRGVSLYLKNKNEVEKQKTIQKQMEFAVTKLHTKNIELEKIKQEIQDINVHKKIKEDELKKLNRLKENESSLLTEIERIEQQIDAKWANIKPFPDSQSKNRLVIINPYLGGYKCFYNNGLDLKEYPTSSLVHRWVWKHKTGNWPKLGYHIHHIDGDKYNNDPDNLEEIDGDEHFEMHRNK